MCNDFLPEMTLNFIVFTCIPRRTSRPWMRPSAIEQEEMIAAVFTSEPDTLSYKYNIFWINLILVSNEME